MTTVLDHPAAALTGDRIPPDLWERLARAEVHPQRLEILDLLFETDRPWSPKELTNHFGGILPLVSYHVRVLGRQGFVEIAAERRVRGAVEHFYVLCERFADA